VKLLYKSPDSGYRGFCFAGFCFAENASPQRANMMCNENKMLKKISRIHIVTGSGHINIYLKYSFSQGNTWKNKKSRPGDIQAAFRQKNSYGLDSRDYTNSSFNLFITNKFFKFNHPIRKGEQGVIFAHAYILSGMNLGPQLTDQNIPCTYLLTSEALYSSSLANTIPTVPGTSTSFLMCHNVLP
jgi:hypothetical protein